MNGHLFRLTEFNRNSIIFLTERQILTNMPLPGPRINMLVLLLLCLGLRANAQAVILENDVVRQEWLFANGWQSVQLCGLIPQQEYGFRLTGEMPLLAPVSWQVENGEFLSNTNGVLRFKADGSCATIQLYFHQADPVDQFPRGFSAWCTDCPQSKQVANRGIGVDYLPLDLLVEDVLRSSRE